MTETTGRGFWAPSAKLMRFAYAAFAFGVGAWLLRNWLRGILSFDWQLAGRHDAAVDWAAARLYWHGISPYSLDGLRAIGVAAFGHPPTTPFWFLGISSYPFVPMAQTLAFVAVACAVALVVVVVRELSLPEPVPTAFLASALLLSTSGMILHVFVVQLSACIALASVLSWRWLRRGRDVPAGIALGLACTMKPFPGLIVLFLLLVGRVRAVVASVLAFLGVAIVMAIPWGLEAWSAFFRQQVPIASFWIGHWRNASIHGILRRAVTSPCGRLPAGNQTALWLTIATCAAVLGLSLWLVLRARKRHPQREWFDVSYALFCLLAAFLNPWVWEHYNTMWVLPLFILLTWLGRRYLTTATSWLRGTLPHVRMARASFAAVAICLLLTFFVQVELRPWYLGDKLFERYCYRLEPPEVQAWLFPRIQYLVVTAWLIWPVLIAAFLGMLAWLGRDSRSHADPN